MQRSVLGSLLLACVHADLGPPGLWPLPRSLSFGAQRGELAPSFRVQVVEVGARGDRPSGAKADMVNEAVGRYYKMCFPTHSLMRSTNGPDQLETLRIEVPAAARNPMDLKSAAENYTLSVAFPTALLTASSGVGVLRGLETFCQMLQQEIYHGPLSILEGKISDHPRFGFRGLLVDSSRHFLPLDVLREHVDSMLYNKMNVLHWHIVDGNSFAYQSKVLPDLSGKAAFTQREVYTLEEIADFVEFARLRGVRVLPEFDTPGHVFPSWGLGYPDVVTKCADGSTGPLRVDLNSTYDFIKKLFTEVGQIFPDSFLHLGGDEVSFDCWNSNEEVAAFMEAHGFDGAALENYYESRLLDIVGKLGKSYVVWQEIFNNGLKVKADTVIDVWKGFDKKTLAQAAAQNFTVIVSGSWYLDDGDGACCTFDGWKLYAQDPADFDGGAEAEAAGRLLGGKACMWGEHVDATNSVSRIWPRASTVGERLWSDPSVKDVASADPRLKAFRCSIVNRGITAEPVDPGFCPNGVPYHYVPPYMRTMRTLMV